MAMLTGYMLRYLDVRTVGLCHSVQGCVKILFEQLGMEEFIGSRLIKTLDLGIGGALYGGRMLEMMAEQAAIHAMKLTGEAHLVGFRFGDVTLRRPVREGEILDFYAGAPHFTSCSVTFPLAGRVGNAQALTAECTFVAVDAHGNKKKIDRHNPDSPPLQTGDPMLY